MMLRRRDVSGTRADVPQPKLMRGRLGPRAGGATRRGAMAPGAGGAPTLPPTPRAAARRPEAEARPLKRPALAVRPVARRVVRLRRAEELLAGDPPRNGQTWLQVASVTPRTRDLYERVWQMILGAVGPRRAVLVTEQDWDEEMATLMDLMFFDGQAASCGERALAALIWKKPSLGRRMGGRMTASYK